jgi:hypothetical protein
MTERARGVPLAGRAAGRGWVEALRASLRAFPSSNRSAKLRLLCLIDAQVRAAARGAGSSGPLRPSARRRSAFAAAEAP